MKKYYKAESAVITGKVSISEDVGIWHNATIRGDMAPISIGARSNVQDNCVLHVDPNLPLEVGEGVTIGHGAILHSCTVGNNVMIGMGAIVLNGAKIGDGAIIAAGALVLESADIPAGAIAMGSPAKVRGEVKEEQKQAVIENGNNYVDYARRSLSFVELP